MRLYELVNLIKIAEQFRRIVDSEESRTQKSLKISRLMNDMRVKFQIPDLTDPQFAQYALENREVAKLYTTLSLARVIEEKEVVS